jgi:transposase
MAPKNRTAGKQRPVDPRILSWTRPTGACFLRMAATAAEADRAGQVRAGGDEAFRGGNRSTHRTGAGQWRPPSNSARCRNAQAGAGGASEPGVIHLPASVRVYLCTSPCDMRRSFDGLHALVTGAMKLDAFAGHLFCFANRRRDRVKILYWDRDGFAVWAKRLEEGTYAMPFEEGDQPRREITAQELAALLSGIDLSVAMRRKRYRRKNAEAA